MLTAKDVQGVMAMMPSFSTKDAGDLTSKNSIDVDNLKTGVDRMINDGIDVITTTGSFGECYNLHWDEYKTLAVAAVDAVKKRVPGSVRFDETELSCRYQRCRRSFEQSLS